MRNRTSAIGNRQSAIRTVAACVGLLFAGACTDTGSGPNSMNTQVLLTDAPFPYEDVAKVEVFINQVDASADTDTSNGMGSWTTIAQPMQTFDLLQLQSGATAILGNSELPAGSFQAIRMIIDPAQSTITMKDGSIASVRWPQVPGGLITMHALVEGSLVTGPGARIVIDFDVGRSFLVLESFPEQFVFSPWIRAVNEASTGDIAGNVNWSNSIEGSGGFGGNGGVFANASVTVYRSHPANANSWWVAATGRTDANGNYRIAFLAAPGSYQVRMSGTTPEGFGCIQFTDIEVERGETTTLNGIVMPLDGCLQDGPIDTTGVDTTSQNPGGPVAAVNIQTWYPASGIAVGDSIGAAAQLLNAQGAVLSGRSVTWTLSDPTVFAIQAQFSHYVVLRALKQGTTLLTASSEGKSNSVSLTVGAGTPPDGTIDTVRLTPNGGSVRVGDTLGIHSQAVDFPANVACPTAWSWSIADPTVFQNVHNPGNYLVVRALKAGASIITATCGNRSGAGYFTAYADTTTGGGGNNTVATITLSAWPSLTPAVGDSLIIGAQLKNAAGQSIFNRTVTWTLSDSTMLNPRAFYPQSVYGRPVRAGTFTVAAAIDGKTATATVTVQ